MMGSPRPSTTSSAILRGLCPACRHGRIAKGLLDMEKECPSCGYRISQESGYFLGAMMVGFLAASVLTIPPVIVLKVFDAEDWLVVAYPFFQYLILGPLLIYYAKIIWVHMGYRAGEKMDRD